ncbi:MAG: outer-membrane lipoprotein carrier protein LolA [Desulfuromonadales bacterium]
MKRFLLLGLFLVLLPWPAAGGETSPDLSTVVRSLEAPFGAKATGPGAIDNFQADFVQTSRIVSLDREQKGGGKVTVRFARSGADNFPAFRWEYEKPSLQEIISDGRTLWVYVPDSRQVIESKLDSSNLNKSGNPLLFLAELGDLSKVFNISWADPKQDAAGNFLLELVPKEPSPLLQRLRILVRRQALPEFAPSGKERIFPILASTVVDSSGNSTRIEFKNIRMNLKLPGDFFHFKVPKGVEVVHSMEELGGGGGK